MRLFSLIGYHIYTTQLGDLILVLPLWNKYINFMRKSRNPRNPHFSNFIRVPLVPLKSSGSLISVDRSTSLSFFYCALSISVENCHRTLYFKMLLPKLSQFQLEILLQSSSKSSSSAFVGKNSQNWGWRICLPYLSILERITFWYIFKNLIMGDISLSKFVSLGKISDAKWK